MIALSFVWVHPYSQNSRCDITETERGSIVCENGDKLIESCHMSCVFFSKVLNFTYIHVW